MVDPRALDVGYLALFTGWAFADEVQRALRRRHPRLRFAWGFVFQHLIAAGDAGLTVGELAARLEVTQQGASKAAREIAAAGYVEVRVDPGDARVRRVRLTQKGWAAVEAARRERAKVAARLEKKLGRRASARLRGDLATLLTALGGVEAVRGRRVVAPR